MSAYILILGLFCFLSRTHAQLDNTVCTPFTENDDQLGPAKPTLPETYTARVECNILDKQHTTDVVEYYSKDKNVASVFQTLSNQTAQLLYNFDTNELLLVTNGICVVDALDTDSNDFLFGFQKVNSSMDRVFSVYGALRFGGSTKEKYMGKNTVRGMNVNTWQSCTYWPALLATSKVTWHFTDGNSWDEATGSTSLPVRCEITGKATDPTTGAKRSYHHIYEFSHFRGTIDTTDKVFETPTGVFCPGRKNTLPLPQPGSYFEFNSEVIIPEAKVRSNIMQYYDFTTKLFRYDWKPLGSFSPSKYGNNPLTSIHDYNTGVAYITDKVLKNCSVETIDPASADAVQNDDNTVRMRTPAEFFDFNEKNFEYEGVRTSHGIDSNVWISSRTDWPKDTPVPSTWEWYFATKDWVESSQNVYEAGEPKRLEVRVNNQPYSVYNIYQYTETEPYLWDFDVSGCFGPTGRRHFQFELPGDFKSIVITDESTFKYAVLLSIIGYTSISAIRVYDIRVDYDETAIRVTFTMLDVAPIQGNIQKGVTEMPLDAAAQIFTGAVQDGQFVVEMPVKSLTDPVRLTAKSESVRELEVREFLNSRIPKTPANTYSPGAMAAVGVILSIVGFLVGGGVMFIVYKKKGGAFSNKDSAPASFDNPAADKS